MATKTPSRPSAKRPAVKASAGRQIDRIVSSVEQVNGTSADDRSAFSICPVEQIGRLAARLSQAYDAADTFATKHRADVEETAAEAAKDHLYDRQTFLRDACAYECARSPLGAMYQLGAVDYWLDVIIELAGQENIREIEKLERRAHAALYSVLRYLEASSGQHRGAVGADHLMPDFLDPHSRVARALGGEFGHDPRRLAETPMATTASAPFLPLAAAVAPHGAIAPKVGDPAVASSLPISDLIERHKALSVAQEELYRGDAVEQSAEWTEALDRAAETMQAIADCEPATIEECREAAVYIAEHPVNQGYGDYQLLCDAQRTMANALKALVP